MTTAQSLHTLVASLRALTEKATPAPWELTPDCYGGKEELWGHFHSAGPALFEGKDPGEDAALIVAMRNALPALLQAAEAQPAGDAAKVLTHKWLDPECVESGCVSLKWTEAKQKAAALQAELAALETMRCNQIDALRAKLAEMEDDLTRERETTIALSRAERDRLIEQRDAALAKLAEMEKELDQFKGAAKHHATMAAHWVNECDRMKSTSALDRNNAIRWEREATAAQAQLAETERQRDKLKFAADLNGDHAKRQADRADAAEQDAAGLRRRITAALEHLMNLQPHIAQIPKRYQCFINPHVDMAMAHLDSASEPPKPPEAKAK